MELTESRYPITGRNPSARILLAKLRDLRTGSLDVELDGRIEHLEGGDVGPAGHIQIEHPSRLLRRVATGGSIGFAEGFIAGDWHSEDLTSLLWVLAVNGQGDYRPAGASLATRVLNRVRHHFNSNSRQGSRRNIAYHYDLGNDFYHCWLDPGMTYSAGVFQHDDDTLEEAQTQKYERMLALTGARPGQEILEIGCGWGGFAEHAGRQDMNVTGVTLSGRQLTWARERLLRAGLSARSDVRFQDYRDIEGKFDQIVSIEMFEAVGERYWPVFMKKVAQLLKPGGRAALQIITIADEAFERYRREPDFIQRYIFPGGMLPSVRAFDAAVSHAGLTVGEREFDGTGYARTLRLWHERFVKHTEALSELGLDERFQRMWRYYLAYCEAGFRSRRIDLMRVTLTR